MKPLYNFLRYCLLFASLVTATACRHNPARAREQRVMESAAELDAVLTQVIPDSDRRNNLLTLADQLELVLKTSALDLLEMEVEQQNLIRDYQSTKKDFEDLGNRMQAQRTKLTNDFLELRQKMTSLTTDAEWEEITSRDEALLKIWGNN